MNCLHILGQLAVSQSCRFCVCICNTSPHKHLWTQHHLLLWRRRNQGCTSQQSGAGIQRNLTGVSPKLKNSCQQGHSGETRFVAVLMSQYHHRLLVNWSGALWKTVHWQIWCVGVQEVWSLKMSCNCWSEDVTVLLIRYGCNIFTGTVLPAILRVSKFWNLRDYNPGVGGSHLWRGMRSVECF